MGDGVTLLLNTITFLLRVNECPIKLVQIKSTSSNHKVLQLTITWLTTLINVKTDTAFQSKKWGYKSEGQK